MKRIHTAALIAGILAGIAGLLVFLALHALWIVPIWFILPVEPTGALTVFRRRAARWRAHDQMRHRHTKQPPNSRVRLNLPL